LGFSTAFARIMSATGQTDDGCNPQCGLPEERLYVIRAQQQIITAVRRTPGAASFVRERNVAVILQRQAETTAAAASGELAPCRHTSSLLPNGRNFATASRNSANWERRGDSTFPFSNTFNICLCRVYQSLNNLKIQFTDNTFKLTQYIRFRVNWMQIIVLFDFSEEFKCAALLDFIFLLSSKSISPLSPKI